jgi:hypothetical protein
MGFVGTAEFLYNRDVNGIYYINANLPAADVNFAGPDARPRWTVDKCPAASGTQANRIGPDNCHVSNNIVLKNQNEGRAWNLAFTLERPFREGVFVKAGYRYGEAKNTVDPGSIAFGSWNNNQHAGDPNNPGLAFSANSPGHRFFAAGSYRAEYFDFGATTFSLFWESFTGGNTSYTFSGDINGDGGTSNDLIYIPRDQSEMRFQQYTQGSGASAVTFTAEQQAAAWDAYIEQDDYLSEHRGEYAERGAVFLPMVHRADLSIAQELFTNVGGYRNGIEIRADILNFTNLLNSDWGVSQRLINNQPLIVPTAAQGGPANAAGEAQYRLRNISNQLMTTSLEKNAGINDVWRMQFSIRYNFN